MNYLLSNTPNSYDIVHYNHDISENYTDFLQGRAIDNPNPLLFYEIKRKEDINKLKKAHILFSTGPEIISNELRRTLEKYSGELQFFDIDLSFNNEKIPGYSAINILNKVSCVNMEESEYKLTNFDPHNPTYRFYYLKLNEVNGFNIVRCAEMHVKIVVNEQVKKECFQSKLKGLSFTNPLDLTPNNRTNCEVI